MWSFPTALGCVFRQQLPAQPLDVFICAAYHSPTWLPGRRWTLPLPILGRSRRAHLSPSSPSRAAVRMGLATTRVEWGERCREWLGRPVLRLWLVVANEGLAVPSAGLAVPRLRADGQGERDGRPRKRCNIVLWGRLAAAHKAIEVLNEAVGRFECGEVQLCVLRAPPRW